jgi:hypothetical protein
MKRSLLLSVVVCTVLVVQAQKGDKLPDVSPTFKGELVLPVSFKNPIFNSSTETIGQLGGCLQFPLYKGLGIGAGGNYMWWGIKERALAPFVTEGEVQRAVFYGKLQFERYTGERTFYELSFRAGTSTYTFDCPTCPGAETPGFYWSLISGYYIHATDNLAFGLTVGYDRQSTRFDAMDLGLTGFPGRKETSEDRNFQNLVFGLGFSTRLRRSERDAMTW